MGRRGANYGQSLPARCRPWMAGFVRKKTQHNENTKRQDKRSRVAGFASVWVSGQFKPTRGAGTARLGVNRGFFVNVTPVVSCQDDR